MLILYYSYIGRKLEKSKIFANSHESVFISIYETVLKNNIMDDYRKTHNQYN
jgi:hypothetical protein